MVTGHVNGGILHEFRCCANVCFFVFAALVYAILH